MVIPSLAASPGAISRVSVAEPAPLGARTASVSARRGDSLIKTTRTVPSGRRAGEHQQPVVLGLDLRVPAAAGVAERKRGIAPGLERVDVDTVGPDLGE